MNDNRHFRSLDRLRIVDVLRIFAALWILFFHLSWQIKLFFGNLGPVGLFISYGYLGVDLFFILSGFLAVYRYESSITNSATYRDFLLRRLIRLYPLHLTILVFLAVIVLVAPIIGIPVNKPGDFTLTGFISQVFLVSAWNFPAVMSWNYFAWAISALWLTILLTPFFLWCFKRVTSKIGLMAIIVLLASLTPIIMHYWSYNSFVAYALPRVIAGYGIGMALYFLLRNLITAADASASRPLGYIADLTYALYMVQYPVLLFFKKLVPTTIVASQEHIIRAAYVGAEIALCLLAAICAYHTIEKPIARYLSKKIDRFTAR